MSCHCPSRNTHLQLIFGNDNTTALSTRHQLLWIEVTLQQVGGKRLQTQYGCTTIRGVITSDLKTSEQVPKYAGNRLQLVEGDRTTVNRTSRLTCQPLLNAPSTESMLTLWNLQQGQHAMNTFNAHIVEPATGPTCNEHFQCSHCGTCNRANMQ